VVAIVEAKNDSIKSGLGQCIAEMLAAQTFNAQRGNPIPTVYGVVTTGSVWKFLRLTGSLVSADEREYYIKEAERIVGVLLEMVSRST
jgi:transketolase C-terminal domain/subunit